ncbi:MAG: MATE family efflux transporter [Gammaproteobacteria bacterium]|nr:MATE family efflux transporter [Gammaproteobacteria bacterium]
MNNRSNSQTAKRRQSITSEPIAPTLFKLTLPMIYALIAIMGLGLVDSYFISYLGTTELAAMGFIVPISFAMTSASLGLGMAISSITSKLIGAERTQTAARLISDGFLLTVLVSITLSVLLYLNLETVFTMAGADSTTLPAIMAYMRTWLVGCVFLMLTQVCSSTLRAIGDTATSAKLSIVLTVVNLILDPIFIFGLGPIPAYGITGAAIATVIAVFLACAISMYYLGWVEKLLLSELPQWSTFKENLSELMGIAIPAVLANIIVPLTGAVITSIVASYGAAAVAAFGVGGRIEAVSLIVVYALSATLPMFIGQNLGAGKKERISEAIRLSFTFVFILQLVIYLLLLVAAPLIAKGFSDEIEVQNIINSFLLLVPVSYGLSAMIILVNVAMNVLGRPRLALYINLARLFLIYTPLALIGRYLYDLKGIFIGISVGNLIGFILAFMLLRKALDDHGVSLLKQEQVAVKM